jgi:hypothetical protein
VAGALDAEAARSTAVALGCAGEIDADGFGIAALAAGGGPPFGADLQPMIGSDSVTSAIAGDK